MKKNTLDALVLQTLTAIKVGGIGPKYDDSTYVPKTRYPLSPTILSTSTDSVQEIIPDRCYHPEVQVCIDFNHIFVNTLTKEQAKAQGVTKGEPVLDPTLLRNAAINILYKYYVYFEPHFIDYQNKQISETMASALLKEKEKIQKDDIALCAFLNKFINLFITNLSVTRQINSIGTATVTLKESYHDSNGTKVSTLMDPRLEPLFQILAPSLPISIYARGRLYSDYYFPIFNGFIQQVNPKDNQGYMDIDLICKDVLELARTSTEMLNPALIQTAEINKQSFININTMPFYGKDHVSIFKLMFNGGALGYTADAATYMGEVVPLPDNTPPVPEAERTIKLSSLGYNYWDSGESNILVGEKLLNLDKYIKVPKKGTLSFEKHVKHTSYLWRKRALVYWGQKTTPYRSFGLVSPKMYTSDFESRLSVLDKTASLIYYNFYVDGFGDIHFHPQRLANKYLTHTIYDPYAFKDMQLKNPFPSAQIISMEETLANSSLFNKDELVTFLLLIGNNPIIPGSAVMQGTTLRGSAIDKKYFERYGFIRGEEQNELFNYNEKYTDSSGKPFKYFDLAAHELLQYKNASQYTRTASIVFRPEIELALPIYFSDTNEVFYLRDLTHSITIGGEATTTVNGYLGRKLYASPPDLYSYMVANEKLYINRQDLTTDKSQQYIDDVFKQFEKQKENFVLPVSENLQKQEQERSQILAKHLAETNNDTSAEKTKAAQGKRNTKRSNKNASTSATRKTAAKPKN